MKETENKIKLGIGARCFDAKDKFLDQEISHAVLLLLGYYAPLGDAYYCPPPPANGGTYRLDYKAVQYQGNQPIKGTEEWSAYLPHYDNHPRVRYLKTIRELNDFHKGMCGEYLFEIST